MDNCQFCEYNSVKVYSSVIAKKGKKNEKAD